MMCAVCGRLFGDVNRTWQGGLRANVSGVSLEAFSVGEGGRRIRIAGVMGGR